MQEAGTNIAEPLGARRLFRSTDLDEARSIVAEKFCDHRLDIASGARLFDACHHRAEGARTSLNYIRYGADVVIEPGELGSFYLIQVPLVGHAEIDNASGAVETHRGVASILNPHHHTRMRWREGCAQLLLQVDADYLHQVAEAMIGRSLNEPIAFQTAVDARMVQTRDWINRLKTCFRLADHNAIFDGAPDNRQLLIEEQLIEGLLRNQPSNISILLERPREALNNRHVRQAIQYMRDHLSEPISIGEIAQHIGVTSRSLQLGFKPETGQTPLQYLHDLRFREARYLFSRAASDTQVGEICAQAGFAHFGRFSVEFRKRYGMSPKDALGQRIWQ